MPVSAPVETPVEAPKAAPVAAPVEAPKAAPVAAPVEAPKAAPVAAPVEAPKAAPVAAPVEPPKPAMILSAVNAHGFLASGRYVVGVAFVKPPTGNFSHSLDFKLTATVCAGKSGDFACSMTPVAAPLPGNVSFTLGGAAGLDSFSASINNVLYGSITFKTNPNVALHLRREGYPFTNPAEYAWNDANSANGELVLKNPVPGDYLIAALLDGKTNETDFDLISSIKGKNYDKHF